MRSGITPLPILSLFLCSPARYMCGTLAHCRYRRLWWRRLFRVGINCCTVVRNGNYYQMGLLWTR